MAEERPTKIYCSIMVEHEGRLLMVREKKPHNFGKLCLPAGHLEGDESPMECAVREAKEESGYTVEVAGVHAVYIHVKPEEYAVHFCFKGKLRSTEQSAVTDTLGSAWFSREELKLKTTDEFRNALAFEHGQDWLHDVKYAPHELVRVRPHSP